MRLFVGRQPVLDKHLRTVAYELLYRAGSSNQYDGEDAVASTAAVIANTFLALGVDRVVGKHKALVNLPRELLVAPEGLGLPAQLIVLEVLETVTADSEVIGACRRLKDQGYLLALDDFVNRDGYGPLIELADFIKVDFLSTSPGDCRAICDEFGKRGIRMLAEKVETRDVFECARGMGYRYFQGYFFARPEILEGREIPACKWNAFRLLSELHQSDLDFDRLDQLIRQDLAVTRRLMRFVNSAAFAWAEPIGSVRHGLVVLGETEVRRWVALAALPHLATESTSELVRMSLYRARLCELIAGKSVVYSAAPECFLMGLFSLLDSLVGRPLSELLPELGLRVEICRALLGQVGEDDQFKRVLDLCIACEAVDIRKIRAQAECMALPSEWLAELCIEAMNWVEVASQSLGYPD